MSSDEVMYVIKRDGRKEEVSFDKILSRMQELARGLEHVNPTLIAQKVCTQLQDGMMTSQLDDFAAETAASMSARNHPNYGLLAARIVISNHQKNTPPTIEECVHLLSEDNIISDSYFNLAFMSGDKLEKIIDYSRDYMFDYFGFKTLEKGYLLRNKAGKVIERPQHMWIRVALQLHGNPKTPFEKMESNDFEKYDFTLTDESLKKVKETYDALSLGYFIHATPTLFNAGTNHPQLSSCFLMHVGDSITGIYKALSDCAQISKWAGGIGLNIHNIRARGSLINGTNGKSTGIVPMLKVFNDTAKYVNQGGKRNGSFAIYLEPWHADVEDFLRLRLNQGNEDERARDLFYALWIPDLFMKRVEAKGDWTLMCPSECPGLADCWGEEFEKLYTKYESEGKGRKSVPAHKIWQLILDSQIQTGLPYLCYKDAANAKSNQQNLGTIKSSNLCVAPETLVLTDKGQFQIKELHRKKVNVWNGEQWSETQVMKTGENQELIEVHTSDGSVITCTKYHKFILQTIGSNIKNSKRVDAQELKVGDTLLSKYELPIIQGDESFDIPEPYTHGFFCGDGNTFRDNNKRLILCGEKVKLLSYLAVTTVGNVQKNGTIQCMIRKDLADKFLVPINASLGCRLKWLAGYLDADGGVHRYTNKNCDAISVCSINREFLYDVKLLLQSLGIHSKVKLSKMERDEIFPGGKIYTAKELWTIRIGGIALHKLNKLGFKTNRLSFRINKPSVDTTHPIRITAIVDMGRIDDTYCFTELENHAGIFNGILTGQCTEIIEYTSESETSVCNLGSLSLPKFIDEDGTFNLEKLRDYTKILTKNLDMVIDCNFYPTPETRNSNMRNRPVGIGIQGLADVFARLKLSWTSDKAKHLNKKIFEHIYYAAVEASIERAQELAESDIEKWRGIPLAERDGLGQYQSYPGSPASNGKLQFDLWGVDVSDSTLDWDGLKKKLANHGMRNSLLIAPMPTASTSQILGNNECFEPFTTNIYTRHVLAGDFVVINKYLVEDLIEHGQWNSDIRTQIIANNGSIQNIPEIPQMLKDIYKTAWEIPQKTLIDMAADRAPFICQSQSLNLFLGEPTYARITSMHFYAWRKGLKTGCYYLRTKAVASAQKFTIEPPKKTEDKQPEECLMCSA